jgi:pyridoxal phosphate enzyme (YggS family)
VKFIAPFIAMIHSVDSIKLLQEINKEAEKNHRIIPCLIQLHVAQEETKFGIEPQQAMDFFNEIATLSLKNIEIHGLMAMASFTEDQQQIASEFQQVQETFNKIKQAHFPNDSRFSELSIGMSSDYPIAIENGSTMIRIGSAVFA